MLCARDRPKRNSVALQAGLPTSLEEGKATASAAVATGGVGVDGNAGSASGAIERTVDVAVADVDRDVERAEFDRGGLRSDVATGLPGAVHHAGKEDNEDHGANADNEDVGVRSVHAWEDLSVGHGRGCWLLQHVSDDRGSDGEYVPRCGVLCCSLLFFVVIGSSRLL